MMKKTIITLLLLISLLVGGISQSNATMELNYIHFDPAIVASGDEVDIVIQYSAKDAPFEQDQIGDEEYSFEVELMPDDDITKEHITILDSKGDNVKGTIYSGAKYYKVFRVKVDQDAPALNYEFKLTGQWLKNNEPLDANEELKFSMPVKKEGIILDISSIETTPSQVRAGDKFVEVTTYLQNVGHKTAKSIELDIETPENITPSYSDNNRKWVGALKPNSSKEISFYLNLDEYLKSGPYNLTFDMEYMDLDDNKYNKTSTIPLLVKPRPHLIIDEVEGSSLAGENSQIQIWVKNVGETSAESVDVRVLKQNSQPFTFDVRSSYIGELEPGESGLAVLDLEVLPKASIKEHNLELLVRAKGDTDEGDDNIYTFSRSASFDVTGKAPNYNIFYGGIALFVVAVGFGLSKLNKKKKDNK